MKPKPIKPKSIIPLSKIHRSHFYPTSDNWFPNYPNDCVKVTLSETKHKDSVTFRVCISGADDFAMYYDVDCVKGNKRPVGFEDDCMTRHETLLYLLDLVDNKLPSKISIKWCEEQGFYRD